MGEIPPQARPIAIIPLGEKAEQEAIKSARWLREKGYHIELAYKGNMSNRMKKANRANAAAAIILGDTELAKGVVTLKDLGTGEQREVTFDQLETALAPYRDRH
jgi:histidyl-tRNA synthetase